MLFEQHIETDQITSRFRKVRPSRITPKLFLHDILMKAREAKRTIVLPEGDEERILRAASSLTRRGIVDVVLLEVLEEQFDIDEIRSSLTEALNKGTTSLTGLRTELGMI